MNTRGPSIGNGFGNRVTEKIYSKFTRPVRKEPQRLSKIHFRTKMNAVRSFPLSHFKLTQFLRSTRTCSDLKITHIQRELHQLSKFRIIIAHIKCEIRLQRRRLESELSAKSEKSFYRHLSITNTGLIEKGDALRDTNSDHNQMVMWKSGQALVGITDS